MLKRSLLTFIVLLLLGMFVAVCWPVGPAEIPVEMQALCATGGPHHAGLRDYSLPGRKSLP